MQYSEIKTTFAIETISIGTSIVYPWLILSNYFDSKDCYNLNHENLEWNQILIYQLKLSRYKNRMNVDFYDLESIRRTINNESLVNRDSYIINWKFNSVLLSTSCGMIEHLWHHRLQTLKIYKFKLSSPPSNIFHSFWYTTCPVK